MGIGPGGDKVVSTVDLSSTGKGDPRTTEGGHTPALNTTTELCSPNLSLKPVAGTCSPKPSPESVAEKRSQEASPEPVPETCIPNLSGQTAGGPGTLDYAILVRPHVATETGHNHDRLFGLAKAVLLAIGDGYAVDTRRAFRLWWRESEAFTRRGLNADTYWHEFQEALACAKEDRLAKAWRESATTQAPGSEVLIDERMKRLAALCWCLRDGEGEFFLSCRAAGRLLAINHEDANRWMKALVGTGILAVIQVGTQKSGQASRYRYVGKSPNGPAWEVPPSSPGTP